MYYIWIEHNFQQYLKNVYIVIQTLTSVVEADLFKVQLDLTGCSERKLWQGWINKAIWAQRCTKHLFLLHEERFISARKANRTSKSRGSATLSPKRFQLLGLGWVMQASSSAHMQSVYTVPKNYSKLQLLQPPLRAAALLVGGLTYYLQQEPC